MYAVTKNPLMLLFMALAPVMAISTYVEDRRGGKKASEEALKRWEATLAKLGERPAQADVEEERERNAAAPDAGELIHRAVSHTAALWERRPTDPDFLTLRLGSADQPSPLRGRGRPRRRGDLRTEAERDRGQVPHHPGRAGAASPSPRPARSASAARRRASTALARWLARPGGHAAHPARAGDRRRACAPELAGAGWLKWLPHVRRAGSPLEGEPLAVGPIEARRLFEEVIALLRRRREEAERARRRGAPGRGLSCCSSSTSTSRPSAA